MSAIYTVSLGLFQSTLLALQDIDWPLVGDTAEGKKRQKPARLHPFFLVSAVRSPTTIYC